MDPLSLAAPSNMVINISGEMNWNLLTEVGCGNVSVTLCYGYRLGYQLQLGTQRKMTRYQRENKEKSWQLIICVAVLLTIVASTASGNPSKRYRYIIEEWRIFVRSHSANSRPDLYGARKYNRLGSPNRGNSLLSLDDRSRGERGDSKDPEERIRKKDNFILAPPHRSLHTGCQCFSRTVLATLRLRHSWIRFITVITRQFTTHETEGVNMRDWNCMANLSISHSWEGSRMIPEVIVGIPVDEVAPIVLQLH